MKKLTSKQKEVLNYIKDNLEVTPPTFNKIAEGLGYPSRNNIFQLVRALKNKGYLDENRVPTKKDD